MNVMRGAIVVVVALVIAVVILARGLDEAETVDAPATTTTSVAAQPSPAEPPAAPPTPQTTVAAPPPTAATAELPETAPSDMFADPAPPPDPTHDRAEVRVLVANGTQTCGAAGRVATSLSARGFNVLPAVNADSIAEASTVYYVESYGADALVVASLIQVDSSRVTPLPAAPPTSAGDAHVLIHIGDDNLAQPNC